MIDTPNSTKDKQGDLVYKINLGFTYHRKLEWFFNFLDKFAAAIAVIGASSVLASFFVDPNINKYIQIFIVITSTFSLVFGWSSKSRQHAELAARYSGLERELVVYRSDCDEMLLTRVEQMLLDIEAIELPANSALVRVVQDELDLARGADGIDLNSLGIFRKVKAYLGISTSAEKNQFLDSHAFILFMSIAFVVLALAFLIILLHKMMVI